MEMPRKDLRIVKFGRVLGIAHIENIVSIIKQVNAVSSYIPVEFLNSLDILKNGLIKGISNSILIDLYSGFPIFTEFQQACSFHKSSLDSTISLDDVQIRLLQSLDILKPEDINAESLNPLVADINWYLHKKEAAEKTPMIVLHAESQAMEQGIEKLVRVSLSGISMPFNSYMNYQIEVYVAQKINSVTSMLRRSLRRKIVSPEKYAENVSMNYFSQTAGDMFELLKKNHGLVPRKVSQTIIGPFYSEHTGNMKAIDPLSDVFNQFRQYLGHGALSVSSKEASILLAGLDESSQKIGCHLSDSYTYFVNADLKQLIEERAHDSLYSIQSHIHVLENGKRKD